VGRRPAHDAACPGSPLALALRFDEGAPDWPVGRAVMAGSRAVLEWHSDRLADGRRVSPLLYPPEPGLIEARGPAFEGCTASWPTACPMAGAPC
jgi:serine/threonine-protein kinase HipA